MVVAIDFDGTVVTEKFPAVGEPIPGAIETLKWMNSVGIKIILFTMRSHQQKYDPETGKLSECGENDTSVLSDAINWYKDNGISLWAANYNPTQTWSNSRKVYADYYIDDRGIGIPTNNGMLDWVRIKAILEKKLNSKV